MNNTMLEESSKEVMGIYMITNKVNGKIYIGSSMNIRNRWRDHRNKERNTIIHHAIKKYGEDNFLIEVLEKCGKDELINREQYYYDKLIPEYNMIRPIENPMDNEIARESHRLAVQSEERRRLSREVMTKRWAMMTNEEKELLNRSSMTPEARSKRIATQNTEEYKQMASESMKSVWSDPEYYEEHSVIRAEILNEVRQRPEVRSAIAKKSKERWKDKEYRENIIAKTIAPKRKVVYLHDGEKVKKFESISACGRWLSERLGVKEFNAYVNASQAARGVTNHAYGYVVSFSPNVKKHVAVKRTKSVVMLSKDDEFLKLFDSAKEASVEFGCHVSAIGKVCRGENNTAGGYKWMYKEDYEATQ